MEEETIWQSLVKRIDRAVETSTLHETLRSVSFSLVTFFLPTILFFFNEFFFMPWQKMAAGVLPPGDLGLPFFGHMFRFFRNPKVYATERYERYGGISKCLFLGKPAISVLDPDLKKTVLLNEGVYFEINFPASVRKALGSNSIVMKTGADHRRTRALLSKWLTSGYLQRFLPKLEEEVVRSVDQCRLSGSVVFHDEGRDLTMRIMCQLLLSLPEGPISKELSRLFKVWSQGLFSFPALDLPWTRFGKTMKARKGIVKIISQLFLQRKAEQSALTNSEDFQPRDVLDAIISYGSKDAREDEVGHTEMGGKAGGYTEEEVCDITLNLMFAGHSTTASLLTCVLYMLHLHPDVLKELREEHINIAKGKAPEEGLTWDDYKNMKLTQKVIKETERMNPTVGVLFRKALEDVKIGGYTIPKDWPVLVDIKHNGQSMEEYFKNPDQFDPNRFNEPPKQYSFNPFGAGIRICPGMELANLEMSVFLHYFVTRCEWEPLKPDAPPTHMPALPGKGYPIKVVARDMDW